jgi:hypothetical protein
MWHTELEASPRIFNSSVSDMFCVLFVLCSTFGTLFFPPILILIKNLLLPMKGPARFQNYCRFFSFTLSTARYVDPRFDSRGRGTLRATAARKKRRTILKNNTKKQKKTAKSKIRIIFSLCFPWISAPWVSRICRLRKPVTYIPDKKCRQMEKWYTGITCG